MSRHLALLSILIASCTGASAMSPDGSVAPDSARPRHDGGGSPEQDGGTPIDEDAGTVIPEPDAGPTEPGAFPPGWLFTSGNHIYLSDGTTTGAPWMGRGVNVDDIFLCGYNYTLWMDDAESTLQTIVDGLLRDWQPTFLRISLSMASNGVNVSWMDDAQYRTPMTNVIASIGAHPGVYVMVTLRSDESMIGHDEVDGDPEATGLPSDSSTTPDSSRFPTGTDALYTALVDAFASSSFVMFGITNEPGGNRLSDAAIAAAMTHAVGVIRAEEDRLGVPHHIVSVQGNGWTSDISHYAAHPVPFDNVVYEVHGYPPDSYTYSEIPVVIGEYGNLDDSTAFFADLEDKGIPNLAWDFDPYSDCAPDLLDITTDATDLRPSSGWGTVVREYLLAHAP